MKKKLPASHPATNIAWVMAKLHAFCMYLRRVVSPRRFFVRVRDGNPKKQLEVHGHQHRTDDQ
jgi:hypothetical protein